MKKRDILEINVENMEFGGTGTTVVDGIKLSYKGGIAGQKVKMLVKKVRKTKNIVLNGMIIITENTYDLN